MIVLKARGLPAGSRVVALGLLMMVATLLVAAGMLVVGASPAEATTTFTVNKTGDGDDRNLSDARCDTSTNNGSQCTLRAAIEESNDTAGADTIEFDISGATQTIKPGSPLPDITDTLTIDGYTQQGASPNTLAEGNDAVLKVKLNGSNAGTDVDGLEISGTSESTIKGLVINRFGGDGILITGSGATGNKVEGNFIGTNDQGTIDNGNGGDGVFISGDSNTVGGTQPEMRNVISGNAQSGVIITGLLSEGNENRVEGNYIGTTADGTTDMGNSHNGVIIFFGPDNTIGGTAAGAGNVISGNDRSGVLISGSEATENRVEGNYIGTTADSTGDLGNTQDGVTITGGANFTAVGAIASGAGNLIAHNGTDGVWVTDSDPSPAGNTVLSNSIFSNGGLGIDLGSDDVTANDTDDPDAGANNLQNFPVITSAIRSNTTGITTISGTLNSAPSLDYVVQCFLSDGAPASDHGEGSVLLDTIIVVTTDANGDGAFLCHSSLPQIGQVPEQTVSATATDILTTGDTSEFSENEVVVQQ
jgi:hypothetical protein